MGLTPSPRTQHAKGPASLALPGSPQAQAWQWAPSLMETTLRGDRPRPGPGPLAVAPRLLLPSGSRRRSAGLPSRAPPGPAYGPWNLNAPPRRTQRPGVTVPAAGEPKIRPGPAGSRPAGSRFSFDHPGRPGRGTVHWQH